MKRLSAAILSVTFTITVGIARADWRVDAETGVLYESNLSNSQSDKDVESDWAWKSQVSVGNGFQLLRDLRLTLAGDLRGEVWDKFSGFNAIGGGAAADLRYRFGLGRRAPWIALTERLGYDAFQENFRSRWDELLGVHGGIALTDRVTAEAGYTFRNLSANDSFFDLQSNSAHARVVVELTSALQVALGYTFRAGDVISYAVPPQPDIVMFASESRTVRTFGNDPPYTAYRLSGQTHALSVSASCAITKNLSAQFSYEYAATDHRSLTYENHSFEAKIAFAY